jgi:orotidine-5'-phosphate decarboxylase
LPTELITVLDVDSREEAIQIAQSCGDCDWFKIGFQLFTREGPEAVRALQALGKRTMLDLKFHDIPNTVGKAAKSAADLGVGMFTLHASGGRAMIEAARASVADTPTRILAVTVLTSLSEAMLREEVGMAESPGEAVVRLATMAVEAGAHGVVCSPKEITLVRDAIGDDALVVTPGIRPAWASQDDQQRVLTPRDAARKGASHIVVGRPILNHDDPAEAVALIKRELSE